MWLKIQNWTSMWLLLLNMHRICSLGIQKNPFVICIKISNAFELKQFLLVLHTKNKVIPFKSFSWNYKLAVEHIDISSDFEKVSISLIATLSAALFCFFRKPILFFSLNLRFDCFREFLHCVAIRDFQPTKSSGVQ